LHRGKEIIAVFREIQTHHMKAPRLMLNLVVREAITGL